MKCNQRSVSNEGKIEKTDVDNLLMTLENNESEIEKFIMHPELSVYYELYLVEFTERFEIIIIPSFNVTTSKTELADANISQKEQFKLVNELASMNATPPIVFIWYIQIMKRLISSQSCSFSIQIGQQSLHILQGKILCFLTYILLNFKTLDLIIMNELDELVIEFCMQSKLLTNILLRAEEIYNKVADYFKELSEYTCIKLFLYSTSSITISIFLSETIVNSETDQIQFNYCKRLPQNLTLLINIYPISYLNLLESISISDSSILDQFVIVQCYIEILSKPLIKINQFYKLDFQKQFFQRKTFCQTAELKKNKFEKIQFLKYHKDQSLILIGYSEQKNCLNITLSN